jgi:acetyl esterase
MKPVPMQDRMPIDPALRSYLDAIAPPAISPLATDRDRAQLRRALMMKALESRTAIPGLPNGVAARDLSLAGGLTARLFTPPDAPPSLPILIYFHGGGWVAGSIETHDPFCRLFSEAAGILVLSIEFRCAPENRYPSSLDDALAAYRWTLNHASALGGDRQRVLLGGDSAGANLAAVSAHRICADADATKPNALMLLYPVLDHPSAGHASYAENGTGYGLEASLMSWFWQQYADGVSPDDPNISPLRLEKLPVLPPTLVATAEYDPLRDEGIAYAEKLKQAGVEVTHLHAPDMHHNFPVHPGTVARFPQSVEALRQFADWLRTILS